MFVERGCGSSDLGQIGIFFKLKSGFSMVLIQVPFKSLQNIFFKLMIDQSCNKAMLFQIYIYFEILLG